jgi:hypothetical protein
MVPGMTTLKGHFDGKVLIPDEPVDLPVNCPLHIKVEAADSVPKTPLETLVQLARDFPVSPETPPDLAAQHDHYLYRLPKHP